MGNRKGVIRCVGLGPGDEAHLTREALSAITSSNVIVGYKGYIRFIEHFIFDQEVISTGMTGEIQRVRAAVDKSLLGKRVCVISSGDAGIYAMAGLILEVCHELGIGVKRLCSMLNEEDEGEDQKGPTIYFDCVPGVPAFVGASALLGAPLMHDFCSISLSDLLTPWEVIERRLRLAGEGDFVVALYNPRSKKRDWQLTRALEIMGDYRRGETPVGLVKRAMRPGESVTVHTLNDFPVESVDMESIVIVGNSTTFLVGPFMVTPRGYLRKYSLDK